MSKLSSKDLHYACSKEVHDLCTQAGAIRLSANNQQARGGAYRIFRRHVIEACEIANRHIFAPVPGSPVVLDRTEIVTIDSGAVYRDKARITELLETYKK